MALHKCYTTRLLIMSIYGGPRYLKTIDNCLWFIFFCLQKYPEKFNSSINLGWRCIHRDNLRNAEAGLSSGAYAAASSFLVIDSGMLVRVLIFNCNNCNYCNGLYPPRYTQEKQKTVFPHVPFLSKINHNKLNNNTIETPQKAVITIITIITIKLGHTHRVRMKC